MIKPRSRSESLAPLVRTTLASVRLSELADGELLARFTGSRDETAFAELVRRFGPTVLGVCRSIVRNAEDAEDAFQVTFMVLARKAASIRPAGRVGGWLHGVALLTARKARVARARRWAREAGSAGPIDRAAPEEGPEPDVAGILHEELGRLPDRFRLPVVLCELRELTLAQAAVELGWPVGTVASRLSRARELLAARLSRRGLAAAAVAALAPSATAVPPLRLVGASVSAALSGGAVPPVAAPLLNEVLRAMRLVNVRTMCLGLLATLAISAVALGGFVPLQPPAPAPARAAAPIPPAVLAPAADPLDRVKVEELSALLGVPAIEKELGLTADQKAKVADAQVRMAAGAKEWLKKLADDVAGAAENPGPNGVPKVGLETLNIDGLLKMEKAFDKAVLGVLKPAQTRRLKQITLQKMGPSALLDRVVIRALGLTAEQEDRLDAIQSSGMKFADILKARTDSADPKLAERIDDAWAATLKVLTPEQRGKWDALVGERLPTAELLKADAAGPFAKLLKGDLQDLFPADEVPEGMPPAPGGTPPGK